MDVASASADARSFGKYTLVAKLATGGMAEIFLARQLGDGGFEKLVCIKRILPHLAKDPQFVAMFLDEARVVARISHPNVCQVFELGEIEGQYYIAMEYLEGVPLSWFRRRDYYPSTPDVRLVAGFGIQACEGLHHAHQLRRADGSLFGVVHRDVSPQNLFVTVDGVVKVIDFGIAKVQDASIKTSTGAMKGTYAYMAPEQLRGEIVDRRTDVWALGCVMWETLAQRHLFKRDTEFLTFQGITTDPIPNVCELRPDIPPLLGDAVARALERQRDLRFASARAFGEAIAQAVAPLGGPLVGAAIAEEVEMSFSGMIGEQRAMLQAVREGEAFELNTNNKLGYNNKQGTTPTSSIKSKVKRAAEEVAQALAVSRAIEDLEDDPNTPPPLTRRSSAHAVQRATPQGLDAQKPRSRPYDVSPAIITPVGGVPVRPSRPYEAVIPDGPVSQSMGVPRPLPLTATMPVAPAPASKLPWIIATVAIAIAAAAGALLLANGGGGSSSSPTQPSASVASAGQPPSPPAAPQPQAQQPPPQQPAQPQTQQQAAPIDAAAAPAAVADAASIAVEPPVVKQAPRDKKQPAVKKAPAEVVQSGPPGFITINSAAGSYATVFVDGRRYGETPLPKVSLSPGKHSVRAVSASGTAKVYAITIESGKVAPKLIIGW